MTESLQDLLASFDRLSAAEKIVAAREIGRRLRHDNGGDTPGDDELTFLADQLFQMYDHEEESGGRAESTTW